MTTKWWDETSAADDGTLVLDADEWDENEQDWLDDFEFDREEETNRVGGLWDRYSTRSADTAVRAQSALKLVQGLVDTFAIGDKRYHVTFDESVSTAGTSYLTREIVISHKPLFDPNLTAEEAETILTAMATHEASHVRYGRAHAQAVSKEWPDDKLAQRVGNLLDDVRIERRYVSDYPGFGGIFAPAIRYVAESGLRETGEQRYDPSRMTPDTMAVAAVRYADFADWTGREDELRWWTDWAARWTRTDRLAAHVEGVREALARIRQPQPQPDPKPQDGQPGSGDAAEQGAGEQGKREGSEQSEQRDSRAQGGEETGESETSGTGSGTSAQQDGDQGYGKALAGCFAEKIEQAAEASGATDQAIGKSGRDIQKLAEQARALVETDGVKGEVYWGPRGIASRRASVGTDGSMSAAIRAAFAHARTGHWAVQPDLRSGRLASRTMHRIASDDYRLFTRRIAPSEDRYLVWLLVDCSGSMRGWPIQQASRLAAAVAAASRFVPNMRLDVWGWSSAFRFRDAAFGAVRVWTTGDPIANVGYLSSLKMGGTPDKQTLAWAGKAIRAAARPDEHPVIILASDGSGYLRSGGRELVESLRKSGVEVVSVAIGDLNEWYQRDCFGEHGYLPWGGSIRAMARPLGKLLARTLAARSAD